MRLRQDRSFVFKLFDIFKHLRGSGRVDKIKKYRRDFLGSFYRPRPSGFASAFGFGESRRPRSVKTPSEIPLGIPYYNICIYIYMYVYIYIYIYMYIYIYGYVIWWTDQRNLQ